MYFSVCDVKRRRESRVDSSSGGVFLFGYAMPFFCH